MNNQQRKKRSNKSLALNIAAIAIGMMGLAYGFVPLYKLFCEKTGYTGITQRSDSSPSEILDRKVTVTFDSNVSPDLPWEFKPEQRSVTVRVGESTLIFYKARNLSNNPITGTATFNVTPTKVGEYFSKTQCFCFSDQLIKPGEEIEFPVVFYVDPAIEKDKNLDDVKTINLSYTFFQVKDGG